MNREPRDYKHEYTGTTGSLIHTLRERMDSEDPEQLADCLAKSVGFDYIALIALVESCTDWRELMITTSICYHVLQLSFEQKDLVLMQQTRDGNIARLKSHLKTLLRLEKFQPNSLRRLCRERGVWFPELYSNDLIQSTLTDSGSFGDLYLKFPIGTHQELEDFLLETEGNVPLKRTPHSPVKPPRDSDFERRGGKLPIRVVEIHDEEDLAPRLAEWREKAKTLILDAHGGGFEMVVSNKTGQPAQELSKRNLGEKPYDHLFATLARTGSKIVLFSCHLGCRGGLGEDIALHTRTSVAASSDVVNGLSIDMDVPWKHFVQFWTSTRNAQNVAAHTRIIRP